MIRPDELITEVLLPPLPDGTVSLYRKARDRASFAFALASVAVVLHVRDGRTEHAALAFGGLAHRPWRARAAEEILRGAPATEGTYEAAVDAELAAARPAARQRVQGHPGPPAGRRRPGRTRRPPLKSRGLPP